MSILAHHLAELTEIAGPHVTRIRELNLVTGDFDTVLETIPTDESVRQVNVHLTQETIIAIADLKIDCEVDENSLSLMISYIYQRNWAHSLLETTLRPLIFEATDIEYYSEIAQRAILGMQCRYSIVRVFDGGDYSRVLKCLAVEDQAGLLADDLSSYNIDTDSAYRSIYDNLLHEFVESQSHINIIHRESHGSLFQSIPHSGTDTIQTIIIMPLTIGASIKGFINVGYNVHLNLNEYIKMTFSSIVNTLCVAIDNYEKLRELTYLRDIKIREAIEKFQIDLIQGFRHSAHNALMTAEIFRKRMLQYYSYRGDSNVDPAVSLEANIKIADDALHGMASLKAYAEGKEIGNVVVAFERAKELLKVQLRDAAVSMNIEYPKSASFDAHINFEAMRSAFANLILNSIQAMEDARTKIADRRIRVTLKRDGGTILIDYIDSGPGVRVPQGNLKEIDDIWVPGRTGRKKGTGYGLPMVREVIQGLHTGSIDLWSSAGGAHFKIVLRDGMSQ